MSENESSIINSTFVKAMSDPDFFNKEIARLADAEAKYKARVEELVGINGAIDFIADAKLKESEARELLANAKVEADKIERQAKSALDQSQAELEAAKAIKAEAEARQAIVEENKIALDEAEKQHEADFEKLTKQQNELKEKLYLLRDATELSKNFVKTIAELGL